MTVIKLAYSVWSDLDEPDSLTPNNIAEWFMHGANIGKLNNLISTCYSGSNGDISPQLGLEEAAIYGEMYKRLYWTKQINANLGAGGINWIELDEGDGKIRRASPTEVAKGYKDLLTASNLTLKDLITSYKSNSAFPRSNDFAPP